MKRPISADGSAEVLAEGVFCKVPYTRAREESLRKKPQFGTLALVQHCPTLADTPIECLVEFIRAIAAPCDCQRGEPDPEVCVGPPERWERAWAESR